MKKKALPQSWWPVRLKALRFHLLCIAGRVIEHGRRLFLKIAKHHPSFLLYQEAREKLFIFSSAWQVFTFPALLYPIETTTVERISVPGDFKIWGFSPTPGSTSHPFSILMPLKISPTLLSNPLFQKQSILITDYGPQPGRNGQDGLNFQKNASSQSMWLDYRMNRLAQPLYFWPLNKPKKF